MKKNERLFLAIGGVDEDLLRRSEETGRRRRRGLWGGALAAAACLALILAALLPRLRGGEEAPPRPDSGLADPPATVLPTDPVLSPDPALPTDPGVSFAPQSGEAVFHFLRYTGAAEAPGFTVYVNEELYTLSEVGGDYVVRPKDAVQVPGAELSPCELWITHREGLSLEEAKASLPEALGKRYPTLSDWETDPLVGVPRLYGCSGTDWDADYCEVFLFEDGAGGVYELRFTCFMEAVEGHGARFSDMIRTFRPVMRGVPPWLTDLDQAAQAVTRAILADDLSRAADYLAEGAEIDGYGEDVSRYASVTAFDYTVDDAEAPQTATVSVQCRRDIEESYDYLTMELGRAEGRWRVLWAGMEK